MPLNFVEIIKNYFSPVFIEQVATSLHESPDGISKALSAIIPIGLGNILNIANSGREGANHIFEVTYSAADSLPESPDVDYFNKENDSHHFISDIFGGNDSDVIDSVSKFAGIQENSASALMAVAIPPVMGLLGRHAGQKELSAIGLAGFLSSQHHPILQSLPGELSALESISDMDFLTVSHQKSTSATRQTVTKTINEMKAASPTYDENASSGMKWLFPVILVVVVIILIWYFS